MHACRSTLEDPTGLCRDAAAQAPALKIGASAYGLHRPDRLVLYPASPRHAHAWGMRLCDALSDLAPDAVPFTARLRDSGHVSRGLDPSEESVAWWSEERSWRGNVTRVLARALVAARRAGESDPCRYACERARLAGIDPQSWAPLDDPWTARA